MKSGVDVLGNPPSFDLSYTFADRQVLSSPILKSLLLGRRSFQTLSARSQDFKEDSFWAQLEAKKQGWGMRQIHHRGQQPAQYWIDKTR